MSLTAQQHFQTQDKVTAAERRERERYLSYRWLPLKFGKHAGKTLPELMFIDPGYFYWALSEQVFPAKYVEQATIVNCRMKHMLPPRPKPDKWEFLIDLDAKKEFRDFEIVKLGSGDHGSERGRFRFRTQHLDLSIVAGRPRAVCQKMISRIKAEFFSEAGASLSRPDFEKFILRDRNFDLLCLENHALPGTVLRGK